MTESEKDREAVEWMELAIERHEEIRRMAASAAPGIADDIRTERRLLALAREALAMRERGPVWWTVRHKDGTYLDGDPCIWDRPEYVECEEGDEIIPLYAGDPVEVSDE